MKIMVTETVTHYHEVELSDELDVENVLDRANNIKDRYDTGYEALEAVLQNYKDRQGDAFDYEVKSNACGTKCESIDFEYFMDE